MTRGAAVTRQAFAVVLTVLLGSACTTATRSRTGEVEQVSPSVVRSESGPLMVLLSFRHAERHLGDEWLILVAALTGGTTSTTVARQDISVRGPDGIRYPLPSQRAFREAYPQLHVGLRSADVATALQQPFSGLREPCERWFFAGPWESFGYDELDLTTFRVCSGPLVFLVPGGVQPGRWVLEIGLEETTVRIPFVLEDRPEDRR